MKNLIIVFILFTPFLIFAQDTRGSNTITVSGTIKDASNKEPLIGANVVVENTTRGTVTDIDGNFTLGGLAEGDVLVISFTGFISQKVTVSATETELEISLKPDTDLLEEIVVVGYGRQNKKVATGAISTISEDNLDGFATSDAQSTLEGQVTGLIVNESSGQPGSSTTILIRGISTNGDNSPLFILDGLQVPANEIKNLNPADIKSINVLKDAASTAIYGARAANGAVIITTKKGKKGGEFRYETIISTSRPWKLPQMLGARDYATLIREKYANDDNLSGLDGLQFPTLDNLDTFANTSWMNEIFNPASVVTHRISASLPNTFLSLEYWDQDGILGKLEGVPKSGFKRYAARLNSTKNIGKYITVGENIYFNRTEARQISQNNAFGTVLATAFVYDPLTKVRNPAKQYGFEQSRYVQKEYINPLSALFIQNDRGHADQFMGNVYLEVKPWRKLTFKSDFGAVVTWWNYRTFVPDYQFTATRFNPQNQVTQGYGTSESFQFENYLNYTDSVSFLGGEHHINVVAGTSTRTIKSENANGTGRNIPDAVKFDENWQFLNAGIDSLEQSGGSAGVDYAIISYFGRLQYDFEDKYLLTVTVRRDGSSTFGSNNRFGLFPSASIGWVVTEENFFNLNPINFLKVRASWGVNGNDRITPLAFASKIRNVFTYPFGSGGSFIRGSALAAPPNPNIRWEESRQIDIGFEMGLFEDKIKLEFDWYRKTTKDLLMAEVIPGYIGATDNPISNLGEIQNQGIELGLGYTFTRGDFTLSANLTYTRFQNEVLKIAGGSEFLPGWSWPVRNTVISRMTVGKPIGHFVGYKTDGIFQTQEDVFRHINSKGDMLQPKAKPGDLKFLDVNGDDKIDTDDITDIGSPWADHILGLSFKVDYDFKKFGKVYLSFVLSSQIGHNIYRAYERSDIPLTNYQTFWLDRWQTDKPSSELPRLTASDPNNNQRPSDFYVEDGTYLRLRNFQIGYNFSREVLDYIKMKGLRIYFTANNLFTLTKYRGFDPDIGSNGNILDTGIDKGFYPSNRTFSFGASVIF